MLLLYSLCLIHFIGSHVLASHIIPMNNSDLKYMGRWQTTPLGIQTGWPGAYLQTIVHTTELRLLVAQPTSLLTQIDNHSWVHHDLTLATHQDKQHYIELDLIANNNVDWTMGPHKLTVVSTQVAPLHLVGISVADDGSLTLPSTNPTTPRVVEFIGHDVMLDAVSASSSYLPPASSSPPAPPSLITKSFPWLVSDMLGVDHVHTAYSGATLLDDDDRGILGMQTRYFDWSIFSSASSSSGSSAGLSAGSPSNAYDFTSYTPSVIVVLLGQYDDDIPQYRIALVQFLEKVRQRHQSTPILVMSEPLGGMIRSTQASVRQCNDQGDQQIFYIDTTGWLHYDDRVENSDQLTLAHKLAPMIQVKLATPPLPLPEAPPNPALPDDWETMDVGNQGLHGSVTFDAGSSFTLWGSGTSLNDRTDAFRFVYQTLSGKGVIEATVQSHATFASCAKAGIMLREHLALGSAYVSTGISPEDGLFVRTRDYNFNTTRLVKKFLAAPPYRIRLERTSDHDFIAQAKKISVNEEEEEQDNGMDSDDDDWETLTVIPKLTLAQDIYIGLFVTSCDETVVSVAKFTDVTLKGGVGRLGRAYSTSPRFIDQSHPLF
ncbi:unnamed protein product [Absidia cylindrospora]